VKTGLAIGAAELLKLTTDVSCNAAELQRLLGRYTATGQIEVEGNSGSATPSGGGAEGPALTWRRGVVPTG